MLGLRRDWMIASVNVQGSGVELAPLLPYGTIINPSSEPVSDVDIAVAVAAVSVVVLVVVVVIVVVVVVVVVIVLCQGSVFSVDKVKNSTLQSPITTTVSSQGGVVTGFKGSRLVLN
jgi:uncharacterized membrane protein YdbT with pleckstrin-like domain